MQRLYGKVAVDLANKPPPYIPIFLTLFKLYGGFLIPNSRNTKTKNNKKKSKLFSTQCNKYQHTFFTTTINLALQIRYGVCRALSLLLLGKPLVHRKQFEALKRYIQQVELL
jgi:hypothetical protein